MFTSVLLMLAGLGASLGIGVSPAAAAPPTGAWTQLSPTTSPSATYGAAMAYDPATSQLVLFGGIVGDELANNTWIWNGTTWTELSPATSPPGTYGGSMAYDPATSQMVLFGGDGSGLGLDNETWTWSGTTWTELDPAASPPGRYFATMAYDTSASQLVLFGGYVGGPGISNDTWTWSGTTWIQVDDSGDPGCTTACTASPGARDLATMAYDTSASQLVLFGGYNGGSGLNDTWIWTGTTWTELSPVTSPPARYFATMAYYPATSVLVLFGGVVGGPPANDTWIWNGTTWAELFPLTSPPVRYEAAMADDPGTDQLVLFSGVDGSNLDDTWRFGFPVVTVTNNAGVIAGGVLTFTAAVAGQTGGPTPTGVLTWAVTKPGGGSVPCSSETGPSGISNVATYTCSITGAIAGTYSATASYPGDANYSAASGSDTTAVVTATPIVQGAPTTGTTTTTGSAAFTAQLATTGQAGPVSFVTTSVACGVHVSSSGAVSTTGTLDAGHCTVSGTDSDAFGDTGVWTYTLTITAVTITQAVPVSGTTTTSASSGFTAQLATTGGSGPVSFVTTSVACGVHVSSSGAISTTGTLDAGHCTVSGTDSDAFGDTGVWTYTLTIAAVTIAQGAPTSGTTTTSASSGFTAHLATTGGSGAVSFLTTSVSCGVVVSSSGAIGTTGTLSAGSCTISGTDSDAFGDTGVWSYTLTIGAVTITQGLPTSGTTTTTGSSTFADQLATTGGSGAVSFVTTSVSCGVVVSSSGAVSTGGTLAAGSCTISGIDSDAFGDSGVWSYTLTIDPVTITQGAPTSGPTTTTGSSTFADQLTTTGQNGVVSFITTSVSCGVVVSGSGAISTTGTLPAGSCAVSGNDSDAFGDTGVWSYTLTIDAVTIAQGAPTSGTTTTTDSSTFADQLTTTGQNGDVSFVATSVSCGVVVSGSGAVSTTGTLDAGSCTVSGTDSDTFGDTGLWTYSLTIYAVTIAQAAPVTGTTTTTDSAAFTDQLATTGQAGPVSFVTSSDPCGVVVSGSGAISVSGTLAAGSCTVSGTDSDGFGDTGVWSYTLTIDAVTIAQAAPTSGTTTTTTSAAFTDQLATTGENGTVSFLTTSVSCGVVVSSSGAISTTGALPAGGCTVSGTDSDTAGDAGTWTYTLVVNGVATTTSLSVSHSSVSYGDEQSEVFTVTVTGANTTAPTGTVTIKDGSVTLCSTTDFTAKSADAVTATCNLSEVQLGVGGYSVTASYGGDDHYNGSTSTAASFNVTKDTVTLAVSASPTTVTAGDESATVFTVTAATGNGEAVPNGTTVVVHVGSTSCVATLESDTGTCSIADSALSVGSYTVTASFGGTSELAASSFTSPTALKVVAATTVPVSPTGEPWSAQLYWWLFGGMGIAALALIEITRRRSVFSRRFRSGT